MTRKPSQSDQKLVEAARTLLDENGFSGLKVRQVTAKAKVNLGMFHYHFKTKDEFTRRVLQDFYEKFFQGFSLESGSDAPPLERLRRALNNLGQFNRDNRRMILAMIHDALQSNQAVIRFVKVNFPRHGTVILRLIRQCQDEGALDKRPLHTVMPLLMGSLFGPNLMFGILEHVEAKTVFGMALKAFQGVLLSDDAIAQRVDIVLKGLGAPERTIA